MIRRLEIRDLVVIERAELEPAPGLTAITGETGAGKTVVAQALALLVGAPADARAVRPGARHALVQATVALPQGFWDELDDDDPAAALRDLADDEGEVVTARRVPAEGRARALLDGQAVTRDALAALAGRVLRFSSQHEGKRLVGGAAQLAALDAFAGPEATVAARRVVELRGRLRRLDRALRVAAERREAATRERAALEELVEAVDAAALDPAEEVALRAERERLRHAEALLAGAAGAAETLSPEGDGAGAVDLAGRALRSIQALVTVDATLAGPAEDLAAGQAQLEEAALSLRGYLASLAVAPGRLDEVEERLERYDRLGRRYGPGTEAVLARTAEAREALERLQEGAGADAALVAERSAVLQEARERAAALHDLRAEAAPRLEEAVAAELAELAMPAAALRVRLVPEPGDPPAERAVFLLRANAGLPEAPLAEVASGGELSRVLLALHGVAAHAEPHAVWIFDEVDAGIGGVTATAVAAKLRALAGTRQVLVITHLPQVAAAADRHYRLVKELRDGRATTAIEPVEDEALVHELCRMLGASAGDAGARRHAEELLSRKDGPPVTLRRRARRR